MPRPNSATASGRPAATTEPEREQQDERSGHQAEALRSASALPHFLDRVAAEGDLQIAVARVVGELDQPFAGRDRDVEAALGERQLGDADRAVARVPRRLQSTDTLQAARVTCELLDARELRGGVVGLPCDRDHVAGAAGKLAGEQLLDALGLRVGRGEVRRRLLGEQRGERDHGDERDDPGEDHATAAAVGEAAEAAERRAGLHGGHARRRGAICRRPRSGSWPTTADVRRGRATPGRTRTRTRRAGRDRARRA